MTNTLVLYGSLRVPSDSRLLAIRAGREVQLQGGNIKTYDPTDLPLFDYKSYDHPKVVELHNLGLWADSFIWVSPEYHGGPSGVMKNQIDWLPCRDRAEKVTKGKPVIVMSTTGGHQSFNTINSLVINARWLKMAVMPTHVNWALTYQGINENVSNRIGESVKELINFTV